MTDTLLLIVAMSGWIMALVVNEVWAIMYRKLNRRWFDELTKLNERKP